MSAHTRILFGAATAEAIAAADALAAAGGYSRLGVSTFVIPASADGSDPATHGCFCGLARPEHVALVREAVRQRGLSGVTLMDAPASEWRAAGAFLAHCLADMRLRRIIREEF